MPPPDRSPPAVHHVATFAAAAHTVQTTRHMARRTSVGLLAPIISGNTGIGESFMVPSAEEAEAMWEHALVHYGTMQDTDARHIATIFSSADIPAPSQECRIFLTHEFLIGLGVTSPGDRARVMLAIERMPPPQPFVVGGQVDEQQVKVSTAGVPSGSYSADSEKVRMHVLKNVDHTLTWIDLVGKDAPWGSDQYATSEYARSLEKIRRLFEYTFTESSVNADMNPHASIDGAEDSTIALMQTSLKRATAPGSTPKSATNGTGDNSEYGVERRSSVTGKSRKKLNPEHASEDADIWEIMKTTAPLPHMTHDPKNPGRAAFILRVCTTGEDTKDASFNALTNKWVVWADQSKGLIAMSHRVDSLPLASLRDRDFEAMSDNISFRRVLTCIFVSFLGEFEIALDAGNETLDDCECHMLDHTRHNDLLEKLFFLERKASVYERMIDLNKALMQEIGSYFNMSRDIAFLEDRWARLREKASALQDRSSNLLQLLLALSGHRTNQLMAVLTRFSLVFTPLTFIAGVYGMNFENMPELAYENGYFICLGAMLFIFIVGTIWSMKL
jgi:magnesium transporter